MGDGWIPTYLERYMLRVYLSEKVKGRRREAGREREEEKKGNEREKKE